MKFTLARFGSEEVEVDPDTVIEFPNGLPGFEDCKHFKLFHAGDNPVVFWLQSLDDPCVVFSLADPELLKIFYELTLSDEEEKMLHAAPGDDLRIAVILSRQSEGIESDSAAQSAVLPNFRSPVVINVTKRIALQKPLPNAELLVRV